MTVRTHPLSLTAAFLLAAVLAAGCAGAPAPTEKIVTAERAVQNARMNNATVNAPLDLRLAEDKLAQARSASEKEDNEIAARLADEALADAEVADAKSRAARTASLSREMNESVDVLRRELDRDSSR